jgi:Mg2+ and Co2+ transporter CorA
MDDLRKSGLRKFVDDFVQELDRDTLLHPGKSDQELEEAIRAKIEDTIGNAISPSLPPPREAIRHFDRVALCTTIWPDIRRRRDYEDAERRLGTIMKSLEHVLGNLQDVLSASLSVVMRSVGSALIKSSERVQELLGSYMSQYNNRANSAATSRRAMLVLDIHSRYA